MNKFWINFGVVWAFHVLHRTVTCLFYSPCFRVRDTLPSAAFRLMNRKEFSN